MGIFSLGQLVHFSETAIGLDTFNSFTEDGTQWWPFAIAGINISNAIVRLMKRSMLITNYLQHFIHKNSPSDFLPLLYSRIFSRLLRKWKQSNKDILQFNELLSSAIAE